jgi:hypothetical protein
MNKVLKRRLLMVGLSFHAGGHRVQLAERTYSGNPALNGRGDSASTSEDRLLLLSLRAQL